MLGMGLAEVADGIGRNDLRLPRATVITEEFSVCSSAIDDVGIGRIRRDVTTLARACGVPVAEGDGAVIAAVKDINAAAILLRSVNVVGEVVIDSNVIELRGGLIEPTAPGAATVNAHARALVTAKDHALWI